MPNHFTVLPAINPQTILGEAKLVLLERAGVTDHDLIRRILDEDRTVENACPQMVTDIQRTADVREAHLDHLKNQVNAWRRQLALDALETVPADEQERLVRQLGDRLADPGKMALNDKMTTILEEALRLADDSNGPPTVKIIPDSVLGILEDLEQYTGETTPHRVGRPEGVPSHLTMAELLQHCSMVTGSSEPEAAWTLRETARQVMTELGEAFNPDTMPFQTLQREVRRHGVDHTRAVAMLKAILSGIQPRDDSQ